VFRLSLGALPDGLKKIGEIRIQEIKFMLGQIANLDWTAVPLTMTATGCRDK
jgi:hypothetical protein